MEKEDLAYFVNYDYSLLENPDYKEDSVREELVSPLLRLLQYQMGSKNTIIRSKALKHPYLTTGSSQRKITYIPDYILGNENGNIFVLDAKAPDENVLDGKNVEQAYSYAIHPEIRTTLFSLCNGHIISLFMINKSKPVLTIQLKELDKYWNKLARILHPDILANPELVNYYPDFGIYISTFSESCKIFIFMEIHTKAISRIDDERFTCSTTNMINDIRFAQSIDFNKDFLEEILQKCNNTYREKIMYSLSHAPFSFFGDSGDEDIVFAVKTYLSETVIDNPEESFRPFVAIKVI